MLYGISSFSITLYVEAVDLGASPARATKLHRRAPGLAEAHGGAGGDVQAIAARAARGRTAARGWSRRNDNASRPGSGRSPVLATQRRDLAAGALILGPRRRSRHRFRLEPRPTLLNAELKVHKLAVPLRFALGLTVHRSLNDAAPALTPPPGLPRRATTPTYFRTRLHPYRIAGAR